MGKTRYTSLDVCCAVQNIRPQVLGSRVVNIYDLNSRTFLFKLQGPQGKVQLLVESGNRMHTTTFDRERNDTPNGFAVKLRKHIRKARVENLEQLGVDRTVKMTFQIGEAVYFVIFQFYAGGNIILLDSAQTILSLLRPYEDGDALRVAVHETFPLDKFQVMQRPSEDEVRATLSKKNKKDKIASALSACFVFGGGIVEHLLYESRWSNAKMNTLNLDRQSTDLSELMALLEGGYALYEQARNETVPACVTFHRTQGRDGEEMEIYDDVEPMIFKHVQRAEGVKEFPCFNDERRKQRN